MADQSATQTGPGTAAEPARQAEARGWGFFSNGATAILIFVLGVLTGFPAATLGVGFFIDNAVPVFGGMVAVLLIALVAMGLVIAFRRRIWQALFRRGEFEAERIAGPLASLVRYAAERKVDEATLAAREVGELAISRISWILTRRWMITTLTALVAAVAALAAAALLFQQNQLLRAQADLLAEQNNRISEQTVLLDTQIQLGEAQRSTSIVPEILAIGAAIGEETETLAGDGRPAPIFDASELSLGLRARIVAATNAARPYRHLVSGHSGLNEIEIIAAAVKRRTDLVATISDYERWQQSQPLARPLEELDQPSDQLTDRESSPERGQLISLLFNSRVLDTEAFSFAGADFSFAELRQPELGPMSFRHARLRFSDFSGISLNSVGFGAAWLEHARFRNARVVDVGFSSLASDEIEAPYKPDPSLDMWDTRMSGADFTGAFIDGSRFVAVEALAANFDSSFLVDCDFADATLDAATFKQAVFYRTSLAGASLASVDFADAITFESNFLDRLAEEALNFVRDRFTLEPMTFEEIQNHPHGLNAPEELSRGLQDGSIIAYRIRRIGEFESAAGPNSTGLLSENAQDAGPAGDDEGVPQDRGVVVEKGQ